MGAEFYNQCCQSPSGLTQFCHRGSPSFLGCHLLVSSSDLFPVSTFIPSFMFSFVLQATSQILILPAVFKICFWTPVNTMKYPSNNVYYQTLGNITIIWRKCVRRLRLRRRWSQTLFSSLQVIFQSSGWGRSLNHWLFWVFAVDKRNHLVWQLT